jgi:hypothetical protein
VGGVEAGAADYDPFGEGEEAGGGAPLRELEEGVGAGEDEELVGGLEGGAELFEGVDGVAGRVAGERGFEGGGQEAGRATVGGWSFGAEELGQGETVGVGGLRAVGLERLVAGGDEEDAIEREGLRSSGGDGEMAAVGRVEAAAEVAEAHTDVLHDCVRSIR